MKALIAALWFFAATAHAQWATPPYNAADFKGDGSMQVVIQPAGVKTYQYMMIGKAMFLSFYLDPISVGGTPSGGILVRIPDGKTAAKYELSLVYVYDNGVATAGYANVIPGAQFIYIAKIGGANFQPSAYHTNILGQFSLEIQ